MAKINATSVASATSSKTRTRIKQTTSSSATDRAKKSKPQAGNCAVGPEQASNSVDIPLFPHNHFPADQDYRIRLDDEQRRVPHYILRCGDRYLSSDLGDKLTDKIAEAFIDPNYTTMSSLCETYSKLHHPSKWPVPLVIDQLVVEHNGVITGVKALGHDDLDGPVLARAPLTKWGGPRHNVALAECAEVEQRSSDTISGHFTLLASSPMFKLLMEDYKGDLAKPDGLEPDWYLTFFAARLFYAGIVAGRRENGQRDDFGDLLHDAPWRPAPQDSAVNPATKSACL